MLSAGLRFFILLELGFYVLVAAKGFGLDWGPSLAAAVAWFIGGRAGFIGVTYVFALAFHSPASRLSVGRAMAMVCAEFAAFLALFVCIQPFERLWMGGDRLPAGRRVLLLVHGYGCNRGAWWWLRRRLERDGYAVATLNLEPPYTDIGNFVPQLRQRIDAVCREAGVERLHLVAHSMGGLVARACLASDGAARVSSLVTLATPHGGSELARFGIGPNARQMTPDSAWLRALPPAVGFPVTAVRNEHDNFVMPQDLQRLPGAVDVALPGLGHLAMLFSPRVAAALGVALGRE